MAPHRRCCILGQGALIWGMHYPVYFLNIHLAFFATLR
jgi:hypothetical protein